MITLTSGLSYLDLNFLGVPQIIATGVIHGSDGVALIDPGPSSTLASLRAALGKAGITIADVRTILLTHIHLDHAGATGTLVKENPAIRVYVHEKGTSHMAAPESLIASATRLWGDDMDRLWGEFLPVPHGAMTSLAGGERLTAGGRSLEVLYTPGHAQHHVSYLVGDAGIAFVGDTAGIRRKNEGVVLPPTPPPDIDLEVWRQSLDLLRDIDPSGLFVTHFGVYGDGRRHLAEMSEYLAVLSDLVRTSLARDGDDESREAWFTEQLRTLLRRRLSEADAEAYEVAGRFDISWRGLARYWRKRA
jgi:glyoxylase-like metal-dependent hydrolase (beta-lactamase superfamily II)